MKSRIAHNKDCKRYKNIDGKYYYMKGSRLFSLVLLASTMTFNLFILGYSQIREMIYTYNNMPVVEAKEIVVVKETNINKSEKEQIISYIVEVFGDDSVEAIKIAECESRFNPDQVGDQHLMSYDAKYDEMIGDSIGIFQIRTGGEGWNRARANGMSVDEFRIKLKDFHYNIDYAKTIYDREGNWHAWLNCENKAL